MSQFKSQTRRLVLAVALTGASLTSAAVKANVVTDLLGNQLLCALAERDLADMPIEPLFQISVGNQNGLCEAVVPDAENNAFFTDENCTAPVTYTRTSMQDFCAIAADTAELGNGVGIREDAWTLTPGNRLDLGARSLDGVTQPYMQRLVYRQVQTPRGRCDLEMRVYKNHPASTGQRSMIALHGGSWTSRSFGYLGLELSVAHYVDQGFVVYAPFYRLLDNTDSSAACNQAEFSQIVDDGGAALDWVLDNASRFGSSGTPIVFGQSAGAHLALSLSINRPTSISGSILLYPPTDFADFLGRVGSGAYTNPQGLSVLERVVGSADASAVTLPVVIDNSFPTTIAEQGGELPPMFIVHGSADSLVEPRHSVRLCDAIAGRNLAGIDQELGNTNDLREVIQCGNATEPASELHLFRLGEHALDVCINPLIPDLCFSGGAASQALVSQTVGDAVNFSLAAQSAANTNQDPSTDETVEPADVVSMVSTGGGGGGTLGLLSLLLLLSFLLLLPQLRQRR